VAKGGCAGAGAAALPSAVATRPAAQRGRQAQPSRRPRRAAAQRGTARRDISQTAPHAVGCSSTLATADSTYPIGADPAGGEAWGGGRGGAGGVGGGEQREGRNGGFAPMERIKDSIFFGFFSLFGEGKGVVHE